MKFFNILLVSCIFALCAYTKDFSILVNDELAKIRGSLKPYEEAELIIEIKKRLNNMDEKIKTEFIDKIKQSYKENTKKLNAEEFKKYENEVKEAFKTKINSIGDKVKKELGL